MTYGDNLCADANRLCLRAGALLTGGMTGTEMYTLNREQRTQGIVLGPLGNMATEAGRLAVMKAAAVLCASAADMLWNELQQYEPMSEEELAEFERQETETATAAAEPTMPTAEEPPPEAKAETRTTNAMRKRAHIAAAEAIVAFGQRGPPQAQTLETK